jgi:polysaccharide deacetylase family protein (PEP-CTERM system associated)
VSGSTDPVSPGTRPLVNALSVDVEDYFHASALSAAAPRSRWDSLESRVVGNTSRILDLFAEAQTKATFFILGSVAERFPGLVRAIAAQGHEIASHGYAHYRVWEQTQDAFAADVVATKSLLEDVSGQPVIGYRAASFSIDRKTWWAYDALAKAGYRYSSSINPISHDHYGMRAAPRFPFTPAASGIVELPLTTVAIAERRFPASGGGYFRLLPYALSRMAMRRVNARDCQPIHFFFHPWEIDPGQPRLAVGGRSKFRHYVNLATMENKLRRLCADFRWSRTDEVYADTIRGDIVPGRWEAGATESAS